MPETRSLTLSQIEALAHDVLSSNGCDDANAAAIADIVVRAERDGSHSHGLFRLPGYVKGLRSGKVNGHAVPQINEETPVVLKVNGDGGYAPRAQQTGLPALADATEASGIGVLSLTRVHHFAALWPEVEYLAERGLVGIACTAYKPTVAPAGSKEALLGTNPLAFAWPRPGNTPFCFDMATSAMALGDVQIAARDGKSVPPGTGLDATGQPTTDPAEIIKGVLLPFGGYKGSAIALMVELLAAGMTGEYFSFEAAENDNNDGAPPRGGEMIIALSPKQIAGADWAKHAEGFMQRLEAMDNLRLPGQRRHQNRLDTGPCTINADLIATIEALR